MNWLPIVINFLLAIHIIVSLLIVLLVLMQRPKNEGLGAAFGGGMTENLFGAQTSNVLQTATRYLGGLFFALTLLLSYLYVQRTTGGSSLQQRLSAPTVIPATPVPATPAPVPSIGPGATSNEVKVPPAATPAVEGRTPPAVPPVEGATPAPAPAPAPEAAKPESAAPAPAAPPEKAPEKPAETPAAPEKPAN